MQHLSKLFPFVSKCFTISPEGISISEASRRKEANKNFTDSKESIFQILNNSENWYEKSRIVTSAQGISNSTTIQSPNLIEPEVFDIYNEIAVKKAQNAVLGQAISYIDIIRKKILAGLSEDEFEKLGLIKPKIEDSRLVSMKRVSSTTADVDSLCALDNVENLVRYLNLEILNAIIEKGIKIDEALEHEAKAAEYGKLIHSNGFLRKLKNARPNFNQELNATNANFTITDIYILAYSHENYNEIIDEFEKKHENHQKLKNSVMKQIKDIIREFDFKYKQEYVEASNKQNDFLAKHRDELSAYTNQCSLMIGELNKELASLLILA